MLWELIWTSYEIAPPDLRVRCGPFRWRIPLAAIEEVTPSDGFFDRPEREWLTTWSRDKLRIIYRGKSGKTTFSLVAPKDRVSFVAELARVAPGLRVVDETALLRIESDPDESSPP